MKLVILNTADIEGGAARCAERLHRGLRSLGADSTYLVQSKFGTDEDVLTPPSRIGSLSAAVRPRLDRAPLQLYRKRARGYFSTGLMTRFDASAVNALGPDVINLHYVAEGFVPIRALEAFAKPIVWTLHDSWAFTGGCHLPGDCTRYRESCGACPILGSGRSADLSRLIWRTKEASWRDLDMTIVTDSTWLAGCVRESSLFKGRRVEAINPGLSLTRFRPIDRSTARSLLSLPTDRRLILFGAMHGTSDPNKGFQFLQPAIQALSRTDWQIRAELVVFGSSAPRTPPALGMKTHYVGRLHDDVSLSLLYSAADVMVVPSVRESFGQTASEAMACGTPVVAFGATGLLDILDHQRNGYLATPYDPEDLARGIAWVLSRDEEGSRALSRSARAKAESAFSIQDMARKYLDLFRDIRRA
jgi:glycosyltransferase involved in cell wall biosynthesis